METDEYHSEDFNGFDLLSACQQHATYCVGPESISLLDQSVLSGGTTRCWDKTTLIKWFVKSCPYQCYIILEVSGGEVTHKQIDCCFTSCDRCRKPGHTKGRPLDHRLGSYLRTSQLAWPKEAPHLLFRFQQPQQLR
ncbi:hypothetical protein RRG08_027450 [Elysia crispata]|uniref:Uncharacterized protein n=1 Tax=Elysia crispata TaxID=231223 RepID=A0AAE1D3X0_9GAST|nr:hypothetical protein RRG08_027450 [Elysia crispata]